MNVKNSLIALTVLSSTFLATGCASLNPFSAPDVTEIEIKSTAVEKTPLNLDDPRPVSSRKIEWFIITPENKEEILKELEEKKYDVVLYGLTDDGYKNLSLNLAELRAFIMAQRNIINAYREYYEPADVAPTNE